MTLITPPTEVNRQICIVRTQDGVFTALPIRGEDQGVCDLIVFGSPLFGSKPDKEGKRPEVAAQILKGVPYGSKGRDGRNTLFPYWDNN